MSIHIKKKNRGKLHRALGIAKGKKIPASKLKKSKNDSPSMARMKNFARNARKWKHPDGGKVDKRGTYNTWLPGVQTEMFSRWLSDESKKQGRPVSMDLDSYDVMGFYNAGEKTDSRGHGTDYFKKPYHPTFSDQSKYHGQDGYYGGHWTDSSFVASPTNRQFATPQDMLWQMKEDPGIKLQYDTNKIYENKVKDYSAGGIISEAAAGAGMGALAGSVVPIFGTLAGAGIGLATGLIKGITGHVQEKNAEEEAALMNQAPAQTAASIRSNYAPTFATGGQILKKIPVELEKNETFRQPSDGKIIRLPNSRYHSQGGEPLMLEKGTEVLGNKPDKETGKQFKEVGMKLSRQQEKYLDILNKRRGTISANSADRMLTRVNQEYTDVFDRQESMRCGGKVKRKMQEGGYPVESWMEEPFGFDRTSLGNFYGMGQAGNLPFHNYQNYGTLEEPIRDRSTVQSIPNITNKGIGNFRGMGMVDDMIFNNYINNRLPGASSKPRGTSGRTTVSDIVPMTTGFKTNPSGYTVPPIVPDTLPTTGLSEAVGATGAMTATGAGASFLSKNAGWMGQAMQLAPVAYNLIQGLSKRDKLKSSKYRNPQYDRAISLMANRRFDIDPLLEANKNAAAIGNYNLRSSGAGQYYSGIQGLAANRMRADAAAWSQKNNMDNQYMAQEAQLRAGLGQERAMMDLQVRDMNDRTDAARRAYLGQAAGDLSEYSQVQQLMAGQQERDRMLASLYPDMFSAVYPFMGGAQNIIRKYS